MDLLNMRKDMGFTLVEMMVVIAIMAIVSAIAVPNFYSYAAGMKLRSASRDLYSTLQNTRMKAVRQNTRWAVRFDAPTPTNYRVIDCGIDNTCGTATVPGDDSIKVLTPILPGLSMSQNFADNQVEFNSEGTCNSGTVSVKKIKTPFECDKDQVCAILSLAGGLKLIQGNPSAVNPPDCPCN
jgi:prepilin-type N-terminal cleavage/methylation domain-containing protein